MHKLMWLNFCIVFPWQRYIPAWTHDVISHSSVAKQQQFILCMVLYIAFSDAGQFIACMCQISLVYVSLRKRYESTLSYFLTLVVYKFKRIVGKPNFSHRFKKIVKRYIRVGYNLDIRRQSACLVLNPIRVYSYGFLFNCTTVGQASDSMTALT